MSTSKTLKYISNALKASGNKAKNKALRYLQRIISNTFR